MGLQGRYTFLFDGGMQRGKGWVENSATVRFLAMLLVPKGISDYYHEEFLGTAEKYNLVEPKHTERSDFLIEGLQERGIPTNGLVEYVTDLPYVKVFTSTMKPGRGKQYLSFYVQLGRFRPRKTVTIRPFGAYPDKFVFHAEGRVLKKTEALELLDPKDPGHSILSIQSYKQYSKAALKKMVQIRTEEEKVLPTAQRIIRARR